MGVSEPASVMIVRRTPDVVTVAPCSFVRLQALATSGTTQVVPTAVTTVTATIVHREAASVMVASRWFVSRPQQVTSGATSSVRMDVLELLVTPVSLADGVVPPVRHKSVVELRSLSSGLPMRLVRTDVTTTMLQARRTVTNVRREAVSVLVPSSRSVT